MDRKGFTLIELLAVIIIIGIIATITIVSISDTLKTSKNGLSKIQINNVEKAAESYYIKEGMAEEVSCISVADLINKDYIEQTEVINPKTREPMNGSVKITYEANQYSYEYSEDECGGIIARAVTEENKTLAGNIPKGNYEPGDEYIVNVDGAHEYHFYVLGTEGDKVNLIMSNNICSDGTLATDENTCLSYWMSEEDYNNDVISTNKGPVTAMNYLYETTKNWSNIPNIQVNYIDEGNSEENGYGGITTAGNITIITMKNGTETISYKNLKTRLPKLSEITNNGCQMQIAESCPIWMANGLEAEEDVPREIIGQIFGYWSLSSAGDVESISAYSISYLNYYTIIPINVSDSVGIRPVIELSKSYFSK